MDKESDTTQMNEEGKVMGKPLGKEWGRERKTFLHRSRLSGTQLIALSFLLIIVIGSLLLMLPFATKEGQSTALLDAAFTAVSATCVTGLIVGDTYQHWTTFGQLVIIAMIQLGGLGFMTFSVGVSILMKRRIGLKERGILKESVNTMQIGGVVKLVQRVLLATVCFEGIGAVLLSIRFIGEFGAGKGIYYGIFHSISAFCNAGFDLMGTKDAFSSITTYAGDPMVNVTIMLLIVIGGIGFLVWDDICTQKWHFRQYRLHTKLALTTTAILIFGGALLFWLMERDNALAGAGALTQALASLFQSVTTRTAGFNSINTASLHDSSKFLLSVLMFVGGSPGSTAGGVKTTTVAVLLICLFSSMRRAKGAEVFGRRIADETVIRAGTILFMSLSLDVAAVLAITAIEQKSLADVLFEVCSAQGTVGISTGITGGLKDVSKIILMLLMYCGRIGSLTFALIFTEHKKSAPVHNPAERISVG